MTRTVLALVAAAGLVAAPALAAPKPPHAGPKTPKVSAPKVKTSVKGPKAPKVTGPKAPKTTGPKMTGGSKAPKTTGAPKGPKAAKTGKPVPPGHAKRATTSGTTNAVKPGKGNQPVTTLDGDGTTTTRPAAMPKNEKLAAKLQALLPAGMTIEEAAEGFRNQGQFIAAVRVSNNLGIPFTDLKTSMVTDGLSLGQSIQRLRPGVDADAQAGAATTWTNQQIATNPEPLEPR